MAVSGIYDRDYKILWTNYKAALSYSLTERCFHLTQLLQDSPVKELQYVFPDLIEQIFGRSGQDWGLITLEKDIHYKEFQSIKSFLAPDGPLLKFVYKCLEDSSPKFEFPVSCIPLPSRMMLQEGRTPAVYAKKIQLMNRNIPVLQLNAFEFYFFHFAFYIVNSSLKDTYSRVNQQDTLYAHLLEEYFCYFLPTDGRAVPLYQSPLGVQHSPIQGSPFSSHYGSPRSSQDTMSSKNSSRSIWSTPVMQKPSIFKKDSVFMVASSGSSSFSSSGFGSLQQECWKSEMFLLILKEMYLNQNSTDQQQSVKDFSVRTYVPSHYHVWMVRILVKHLHFFFNSSLASNVSGQIMIDSLERLKSMGMTNAVQKEMYSFLKSTFDHWPLDATFRVPLETWLSYIQPWRYSHADLDVGIWQKFMTENVLFYTSIYQQVLRRFLRMDFNCPKNAYMLYRVTKVFAFNGMREMIMHAEKGCTSKPSSLSMYMQRSPEKSYSLYSVRKISRLEGPGTNYIPLFSEPVFLTVTQLLSIIVAAQEKSQCCIINPSLSNRSFFSKIASFFETSSDGYNSDDNAPIDIKKVSSYLEDSMKQLCTFFQEVKPPTPNTAQSVSSSSFNPSLAAGDCVVSNSLKYLDRFRVLNETKKLNVDLEHNPDLKPVQSYELACLVRFFNEFARQLNEEHGPEIFRLYTQDNWKGKLWRKVLAKPVTYYEIKKSKDMLSVTRTPVHLPPRVYLRFLADKHVVSYFFVYLLLTYLLGFNPLLSVFLLLCTIALLLFIVAFLYPVPIESNLKQD